MLINVDEFLNRYTSKEWGNGQFLDESLCQQLKETTEAFFSIPDDTISLTEKKRHLFWRDQQYAHISYHRNLGMELETEGNLDEALDQYIEAILLGENSCFDLFHSYRPCYDFAILILRKFNMRSQEANLLESLLSQSISESDRERYATRLRNLAI